MNFEVMSCFANFHQSTVSVISANHIKFIVNMMRFVTGKFPYFSVLIVDKNYFSVFLTIWI